MREGGGLKSIKEAISRLNCDNVLECFFGLNQSDVSLYLLLLTSGEMKIEEMSRVLKKAENSVYRSLQKLMLAGIVIREKKIIEGGGYFYVYKALPIREVVKEMKKLLKVWNRKISEAIEEFEKKYGEAK